MSDIFEHIRELTKFELIYKDENNIPQTARSYVKSMANECLLIDPPTKAGRVQNIKDGTTVKMVVYVEGGVFSGESVVLSKELSSAISGVWISYPRNSQYCQRREYIRVPIKKEVKITLFRDTEQNNRHEFTAITRDISGKGISFFSDEEITNYYNIECVIPLKDEFDNLVKVTCEHIYTTQVKVNGETKTVHAFAFVDMMEKYSEKLIKECFQFQLEERRQKLQNVD